MISQKVEAAILSDSRRAALDYISVREILDDAKASRKVGTQSIGRWGAPCAIWLRSRQNALRPSPRILVSGCSNARSSGSA
jgi:hypothetical protein